MTTNIAARPRAKFSEMIVKIHFAVPVMQGWAGGGPNYAAWDRKMPINKGDA